jgi:hypothetical protein
MLVSVAITLIVILAVVQAFSSVGSGVRAAQAVIEMSNELRGVARQIQRDLDAATCPARTWIDPEAAHGYIEIIEGPLRDRDFLVAPDGTALVLTDAEGNEFTRPAFAANPSDAMPYRDLFYSSATPPAPGASAIPYSNPIDSSFGDLDDSFALTVRSEGKPFVGRDWNGNLVESYEAEIIYWTAFLDQNDNDALDPVEPIMLMRRQLLILPGLVSASSVNNRLDNYATGASHGDLHDISVRIQGNNSAVANSLGDLTNPRNRPLHSFIRRPIPHPSLDVFPRIIKPSQMNGPDRYLHRFVILQDLRGFDVRLYDPLAPILMEPNSGVAIAPGDASFPINATAIRSAWDRVLGRGAFVDLGYAIPYDPASGEYVLNPGTADVAAMGNWYSPTNTTGRISYFSGIPSYIESGSDRLKSSSEHFWGWNGELLANDAAFLAMKQFAIRYDTWSTYFERDGLDRGMNPVVTPPPPPGSPAISNGGDLATNGIDDDLANGVDDPGERDTAPPYDVPLRGMEVRLRMLHYETRQVRQVSVVSDFVPE